MSTKGLRGQAFLLSVAMSTRALRHGASRQEWGPGRQRRKPSGGKGREKHLGHTPADVVENAPRNAAKGSLPRRAGSCVRSACAKRVSSCSELSASSCAKRFSSCSAAVCGDEPHFSGSAFLCSSNRSLPERAAGQKPRLGGFDAQCGHGLLPPKGAVCLCAADTPYTMTFFLCIPSP